MSLVTVREIWPKGVVFVSGCSSQMRARSFKIPSKTASRSMDGVWRGGAATSCGISSASLVGTRLFGICRLPPAASARLKRAPGMEKLDGRTSFAMTTDARRCGHRLLYMLKGAPTGPEEKRERHVRPAADSLWLAARKTNTVRLLSS